MYGSRASRSGKRAKLVIRLQFVTLQRLEICVIGRRVHVREEPSGIAELADLFDENDARSHAADELAHFQTPIRETRGRRFETRARVDGAQGMIAAFALRHDDVRLWGERE